MAIVICAAAIGSADISNGADLAKGLEPLFGSYASAFLSIGLFAAGITSAITAPMAAAYVAKGCFGWTGGLKSNRFRAIWISILAIGVLVASTGFKPIQIIQFAQIANGLLLPVIAVFLWWVVNQSKIMGNYTNSLFQNLISITIIIITLMLGVKTFAKVLDLI